MKILVLGDRIVDFYRFGHATRICPEGPVPVIVEDTKDYREGGAALVYQQLIQLTDGVHAIYGSRSKKERIFADDRLVCRLDQDGTEIDPLFTDRVIKTIDFLDDGPSALVISDYGKGSFSKETARQILSKADEKGVVTFIDAKHNWEWWRGGTYFFPNQTEKIPFSVEYLVQKLGKNGCQVKNQWGYDRHFPSEHAFEARDVTGAGDIFLAGFVHKEVALADLPDCAKFANKLAGLSVTRLGTHVVTKEELANV